LEVFSNIYRTANNIALCFKAGYKIIAVDLNDSIPNRQHDFITGFETQGNVIGRPVDIAEDLQGNLFLSDDFSGTVYKITYQPDQNP
jgi:glucose/arabinose dehydrogenase